MSRQHAPTDDVLLVSRAYLALLLRWAGHQPCDPAVKQAQVQLGAELMADEPPEHWFDDEDDPADDNEDVTPAPAWMITTVVMAALVILGVGIAWIVRAVTTP